MSAHIPFDLEKGLLHLIEMRRPMLSCLLERNEAFTILPADRVSDWTYGVGKYTFMRWKLNRQAEEVHVTEIMVAMNLRMKGDVLSQFAEISTRFEDAIRQATEDRMKMVATPPRGKNRLTAFLPIGILLVFATIILFVASKAYDVWHHWPY